MKNLSTIRPITLRDQIVEQVRNAIIEGELKPTDHITEAELTARLGVSRTPVREALILLEAEGLVVFQPNRGSFVRAFDADGVDEVFSMRTTLENFAAELLVGHLAQADFDHLGELVQQISDALRLRQFSAARRLDMAFHQYLIERTGHSILIRAWKQLVAQIALLLHMRLQILPHYPELETAQTDHDRILRDYRAADLDAIRATNRAVNARVAAELKTALADHLPGS